MLVMCDIDVIFWLLPNKAQAIENTNLEYLLVYLNGLELASLIHEDMLFKFLEKIEVNNYFLFATSSLYPPLLRSLTSPLASRLSPLASSLSPFASCLLYLTSRPSGISLSSLYSRLTKNATPLFYSKVLTSTWSKSPTRNNNNTETKYYKGWTAITTTTTTSMATTMYRNRVDLFWRETK